MLLNTIDLEPLQTQVMYVCVCVCMHMYIFLPVQCSISLQNNLFVTNVKDRFWDFSPRLSVCREGLGCF